MSNSSSHSLKPVTAPVNGKLVSELLAATPLYIFATALKAASAQPARR
jgi:hypothetical protein